MHVYSMGAYCVHGGQKRALAALEQVLEMILSYHVAGENRTLAPARPLSALNCGANSPISHEGIL